MALFLASLLLFSTTIPQITFASSFDEGIVQTTEVSQEEKELTDVIQFMFDNAVVYGRDGLVKDINFDVIYEKYGYTEELSRVEAIVEDDLTIKPGVGFRKATAGQCAVTAIQDTLGVASVSALLSGGVVGLLQRKAAAEIAKLILKVGLKNVAPAAAAASLIWSFGRCMWF